jgi:predicted nucleic acid-binding protein
MKYVIDSSVATKWVLPEVHSDKALRLRDQFVSGVHKLVAPEVFSVEVAHALTRAERQGRIAIGDAEVLWADVMTTPLTLARSAVLLTRASKSLRGCASASMTVCTLPWPSAENANSSPPTTGW